MAKASLRKPVNVDEDLHYTLRKLVFDLDGVSIGDEVSRRLRQSFIKDGIDILSPPKSKKKSNLITINS